MSKYSDVMEHIAVTPEMRERILDRAVSAGRIKARPSRFRSAGRILALAACLALLVAGAAAVSSRFAENRAEEFTSELTLGPSQYESAEELSGAGGIPIRDLSWLPFEAEETVYQSFGTGFSEIVYTGEDDRVCYRVSTGSGDTSGDLNEYSWVETRVMDGLTVTLRGEEGLVHCAFYEKDGYSFSITSEKGLTPEQIEKMI
ncbi:MAG: hypothetical protein IJM21_07430 [Clostridia bacterium]|nr:hypothetical protein [Clostridia bacterium]